MALQNIDQQMEAAKKDGKTNSSEPAQAEPGQKGAETKIE